MYRYEQHCPVARAAEVVSEPWTLLVLRELLRGGERRAEIARALPRMSPALLTARLRTLTEHGLVEVSGAGREKRYRLTEAGRDLCPVVDHLGHWGQRWLAPPRVTELDPGVLLLDISREVARVRPPARALNVAVTFAEAPPPARWWLALSPEGTRARAGAPLSSVDVSLRCTLSALADVWLGRRSWLGAVRDRSVVLSGPSDVVRDVIVCVGVSRYAGKETA